MQFNKTEDMISFIRDDITPQEIDAFIGQPFNPVMHPQYGVIKKYIEIINRLTSKEAKFTKNIHVFQGFIK